MDDATLLQAAYDEIYELKASNELLIAELGRIAAALGVETSMVKVLAKIKELKDKP